MSSKIDYKERAKKILDLVQQFSANIKGKSQIHEKKGMNPPLTYEEKELIISLRKAFSEWKNKETYFEWVTDPDLVDLAIYETEASRIKYIYFLKKVREKGISLR